MTSAAWTLLTLFRTALPKRLTIVKTLLPIRLAAVILLKR
ncbi:Uncharacterised protein [Vibrio cholerae]|nr:Uncharacterised protein [Vibrio cholerae]CSB28512.1 Uncharacterised protein [Vibrio cholerae]